MPVCTGAESCENSISYENINTEEHLFDQTIAPKEEKYYQINISEGGKLAILTHGSEYIDTQLLYKDCSRYGDSKSNIITTNTKRLRRYVDAGTYFIKVTNDSEYSNQYFSIENILLKDDYLSDDKDKNTCFYAKSLTASGVYNGEINGKYDQDVFKITTEVASKINISIDNPNVAFMVYSSQESGNICGGLYSYTLNGSYAASSDSLEFFEGRNIYVTVVSDGSFNANKNYTYELKIKKSSISPPETVVPSTVRIENGWLTPKPRWIFSDKKSKFSLTQGMPSYGNHDGDDYFFEDWDKNGTGFQTAEIVAPYSGKVKYIRTGIPNYTNKCWAKFDNYGTDYCYGNQVVIDHGNGVYSRFAHLTDNILVYENQSVNAGDPIGYMGNSGNAYGQHLHMGFYKKIITSDVKKKLSKGKYAKGISVNSKEACKKTLNKLNLSWSIPINKKQEKCISYPTEYAVKFNLN